MLYAGLAILSCSASGYAEQANPAGIITSRSTAATFSAKQLAPGSQIWASWLLLPAGMTAEIPPSGGDKWIHLDVGLRGSIAWSGEMPSECHLIDSGMAAESDSGRTTLSPGSGFACNSFQRGASKEENRGSEPYIHAVLNIGGPWAFGMSSIDDGYSQVPENARVLGVESALFKDVESEIIDKGAVTVTIRSVFMPPGTRLIADDSYPTIRMVTDGQLTWGALPPGATTPNITFTKSKFGELVWGIRPPGTRIVLANQSGVPTEFVEWSVSPADGIMP